MPIKLGSLTLNNVFKGTEQIAKITKGLELIWENLIDATSSQSYSWYSHEGVDKGGRSSKFTLNTCIYPYKVKSGSASHGSYYMDAKVNESDSYTRIASGNPFDVTLTGKTQYKYFRFGATSYTKSKWEDPAGMYYWCEGSCTVYYKKKGS